MLTRVGPRNWKSVRSLGRSVAQVGRNESPHEPEFEGRKETPFQAPVRLTAGNETRLRDVLATVSTACEQQHALLFGDDQVARKQALAAVETAKAELASVQSEIAKQAEVRADAEKAEHLARQAELAKIEARVKEIAAELSVTEARREEAAQRVREAEVLLTEKQHEHDLCTQDAETTVERFERMQQQFGLSPTADQEAELLSLGEEDEQLVERASKTES